MFCFLCLECEKKNLFSFAKVPKALCRSKPLFNFFFWNSFCKNNVNTISGKSNCCSSDRSCLDTCTKESLVLRVEILKMQQQKQHWKNLRIENYFRIAHSFRHLTLYVCYYIFKVKTIRQTRRLGCLLKNSKKERKH